MSIKQEIVDLTSCNEGTADEDKLPEWAAQEQANMATPIGAEWSYDCIDIESEGVDEQTETQSTVEAAQCSVPKVAKVRSHPLQVVAAARKRRLLRLAENEAARKRREDEEAGKNRQRVLFEPNFVIIDDSSDDERSNIDPQSSAEAKSLQKSESTASVSSRNRSRGRPRATPIPVSRSGNIGIPFNQARDFNYQISQEAALEMQERMFREAAARVRAQAWAHSNQTSSRSVPTITEPMYDIADRHPLHWQWKDPYACLGLPTGTNVRAVKSQYRRLARLYHPDKSKQTNTAHKFHGIALAYRKLTHGADT